MFLEQGIDPTPESLKRLIGDFENKTDSKNGKTSSPLAGKLLVNIEVSLWCDFLHGSTLEYFQMEPLRQIAFQLSRQIFAREHFPQAALPLSKTASPDPGLSLVPSLFNIPVIFRNGAEPAPREVVLVNRREDIARLRIPDFQHSGLMPQALFCYRKMKEILGEQWNVGFPDWCRGPLGTAFYLRGFENTLVDLYQDPDFAREVLEFGLRARKSWMSARAELLGLKSPGGAVLWNDDVAKENFSPQIYENHIFPLDTEFHRFHEGKVGFHSCGDTTPFLKIIRNLRPLEFFHVSPWTDLEEAVSIFHPDTLLLVALNPVKDVLGARPEEVRAKLEHIRDVCSGGPYIVLATELMRFRTPEEDMNAIKRMLDIAVEVLCR